MMLLLEDIKTIKCNILDNLNVTHTQIVTGIVTNKLAPLMKKLFMSTNIWR